MKGDTSMAAESVQSSWSNGVSTAWFGNVSSSHKPRRSSWPRRKQKGRFTAGREVQQTSKLVQPSAASSSFTRTAAHSKHHVQHGGSPYAHHAPASSTKIQHCETTSHGSSRPLWSSPHG
ncbi:hypothetical protein VIGAN_11050300 [Vigna angularis var. angularis]|uniref:Uncharacterized protein n=1 Tax=Vigna angularis var. angularis TaxID=157739 RepID=A0A0S3T7X9_PHAAN|nr:hypothetical protein VIGAN_11050300 [Vigna angularis var. angularis]